MSDDLPETVYSSGHTTTIHLDQECGGKGTLNARPIESLPKVWRKWCPNCADHLTDGEIQPQDHSDADPPGHKPKHSVTGQDLYQWRTEDFALKHGLTEEDLRSQIKKLEEEVYELKAAALYGYGDVAEECGDVAFVDHLVGQIASVDVREAFDKVSDENLEKNRETDENGLITKDKEQ